MDKKFGGQDARMDASLIIGGVTLQSELLPPPTESMQIVYSSKDFGDPEIGTVLQWHINICPFCSMSTITAPIPFGRPARHFCSEYWEIVEEYREYEGHYAMRGNP